MIKRVKARPITQEEARQWLILNDPEGASYWRSLPKGTDFIRAMREMIRDFG